MKKILIAEDNEMNFSLFCLILADTGVEILHAINGIEAVEICEKNPDICLVLMDINMPLMNGIDAAILINTKNPKIKIISQTAYGTYGHVNEIDKKHFSDFMTKPIDINLLMTLVNRYCFDEN